VSVTRFIVAGSIEEKMLELQERKRSLCQAALGAASGGAELPDVSKEEARRMRLRDLALCFE
jgi:SNF2 family DNA or RNA helicase